MNTLAILAAANDHILATSNSSDGDSGSIGYVFLASGIIFYIVMYLRYRNSNKRHRHESETEATLLNMEQTDSFVQSKTGMSNSKMQGANNHAVRGAQHRLF